MSETPNVNEAENASRGSACKGGLASARHTLARTLARAEALLATATTYRERLWYLGRVNEARAALRAFDGMTRAR